MVYKKNPSPWQVGGVAEGTHRHGPHPVPIPVAAGLPTASPGCSVPFPCPAWKGALWPGGTGEGEGGVRWAVRRGVLLALQGGKGKKGGKRKERGKKGKKGGKGEETEKRGKKGGKGEETEKRAKRLKVYSSSDFQVDIFHKIENQ